MNLFIAPEIQERYPSYRLTVITGTDIRAGTDDTHINNLLRQQEEIVRQTFEPAELSQHPHIASWRKTYASFGAKPSKHRCAVESLLRAILKRGSLPRINNLVNLCNLVSIKHVLPIDIMDLDNVEGDIGVQFAQGNEKFVTLGSRQLDPPNPGEVVYMDAEEVLGRRWNWHKSEKSKVTPATRNILITIEGIQDISTETLKAAETELCDLLQRFCAGTLTTCHLDAEISARPAAIPQEQA